MPVASQTAGRIAFSSGATSSLYHLFFFVRLILITTMTHFNFQWLHTTVEDLFYKDHCMLETTYGNKKEQISTSGVPDCLQRSDKH